MKAEQFTDALTDINCKYIDEALDYKKIKSNFNVWRIVAIAACVCLAGSLAFTAISMTGGNKADRYINTTAATGILYSNDFGGDAFEGFAMEEALEEEAMLYDTAYSFDDDYDIGGYDAAKNAAWDAADIPAEAATAEEKAEIEAENQMPAKIIYTVDLNMQTTEFDNSVDGIENIVSELGGYYESQSISNNTGTYRNAYYTIRIPAENLNVFLDQMGGISTVTYINRYAQDVSENYYDIQSRLTTAKTKLERLQALLEEAEDMEDIITIESAISDTEWEIDNYSGTIRYYDSRVDYSTVNITLKEVYEVVVEEAPLTFGDRISQAADQGIRGLGVFLQNVVIWFAASWIWILIIAAIVVIIIVIVKRHANKK